MCRVISVGCAVNTGVTQTWRSALQIALPQKPADRMPLERASKRSFGYGARWFKIRSASSPLSMVRFRKIGELEVNGKRFR